MLPQNYSDVDEGGSGDVTIGSSSYKVHHDPEYSGGIICTRMHSPADVIVSCTVPAPQDVSLEPLQQVRREECFSRDREDLANVLMSLEGGSEILSEEAFDEKHNTTALTSIDASDIKMFLSQENVDGDLEKRQGPQCDKLNSFTRREGDGNPHQNPMNVQLSVCLGSRTFPGNFEANLDFFSDDRMKCDATRAEPAVSPAARPPRTRWAGPRTPMPLAGSAVASLSHRPR